MPTRFEEAAGLACTILCLMVALCAPIFGQPGFMLLCLPFYGCALLWHDCRKARDEIESRQAYWDRKLAERLG